jgi:hypothetical protein
MITLTQPVPPRPGRKFPASQWLWDYNPARQRWETYRQPANWPFGLYDWLHEAFGDPLSEDPNSDWDYTGGHIYLYREDYITAFLLRWA